MSSATGLKPTAEPPQPEAKRERRRANSARAAGRAAALRRAPSDSDGSAETASLSADSGERAVRPPPPPPRAAKSRSRRRGSEWEVLEGLKDGQRFDKRPEAFNGYLHKKRKWPLKGWHKRFFVVDGGILVYARSAGDVARGRLHGSVDVGLSVLSAKPRRRRIDIDADEFIYHLRAKTHDAFRTWLHVLKTHRLYRQHLLTFGARESVPKIHAPLDDLPPTTNSSRTIRSSVTQKSKEGLKFPACCDPSYALSFIPSRNLYVSKHISSRNSEQYSAKSKTKLRSKQYCSCPTNSKDKSLLVSLCSWASEKKKSRLDFSNQISNFKSTSNSHRWKTEESKVIENSKEEDKQKCNKKSKEANPIKEPKSRGKTQTVFFFSRLKSVDENLNGSSICKSRKCTNVVKYKNKFDEPPLCNPWNFMVLSKYKTKSHKSASFNLEEDNRKYVSCESVEKLKDLEEQKIVSQYDTIIEKILLSIFDNVKATNKNYNLKIFLCKILRDLYEIKLNSKYDHTVKELFRCLLEYWLKNTMTNFKNTVTENKHIDKQSNTLFMKDQASSNIAIPSIVSIGTQLHSLTNILEEDQSIFYNIKRKRSIFKKISKVIDSFIKEKHIQDLEAEIKSTVYICQAITESRNKDILMTQRLLKNLDNLSDQKITYTHKIADDSDSSELFKIRNTLNQFLRDVSISADTAKDILRLYLNLLNDRSETESMTASDSSVKDAQQKHLECDIETKRVKRNVSESVSTEKCSLLYGPTSDSQQKFRLSNVLGKITAIFGLDNRNNFVVSNTKENNYHSTQQYPQINFSSTQTSKEHRNCDLNDVGLNPFTCNTERDIGSVYRNLNFLLNSDIGKHSCYVSTINESALTKTLKLNDILDSKMNTQNEDIDMSKLSTYSNLIETISIFENPTKFIIDEKLILLLLENLSSLSKNIPHLHKEIDSLYLKLRKRREKKLKVQGLSLLGRIYNDVRTRDNSAQCYKWSCREQQTSTGRNAAVERSTNTSDYDVIGHFKLLENINIRGHNVTNRLNDLTNLNMKPSKVSRVDVLHVSKAISNPNWDKNGTRDCGISNQTDYILNSETSRIISLSKSKLKDPDNRRSSIVEKLIKELTKTASSIGVTTQLQTVTTLRSLRSNAGEYNIYQLFLNQKYVVRNSKAVVNCNKSILDDLKSMYRCSSDSLVTGLVSPTSPPIRGPQAGFVSGTPGGRLASWIIESGSGLESAGRSLTRAQESVAALAWLLAALELPAPDTDASLDPASPALKTTRRRFRLRRKKTNKCASVELPQPAATLDPSASHPALSAMTAPPSPGGGASSVPNSAASLPIACAATRPASLPGGESLAPGPGSLNPDQQQLREDFTVLAKDLVSTLKTVVATLVMERGRLRAAVEAGDSPAAGGVLAALRSNLSTALHQNDELRSRLSRIHDASNLADTEPSPTQDPNRRFPHSLSYSSSCVSASEFFDAEEHEPNDKEEMLDADEAGVIELDGDSSSEAGSLSSDDNSASTDNSDAVVRREERAAAAETRSVGGGVEGVGGGAQWARRTRLPHPRPSPAPPSLWNLLYKNIGKDLSQISMPVTINEPLNMLQRLCEELEYSELLDAAAACSSAAERCALVAAFAVSGYAATAHRAASKPFNPLLGETYECVRADRGFSFLAEQVSHHPPVSACHAQSARWVFWQEARIKTKFWGKSMEFQPAGRVHVRLTATGDHYSWNKVTTCVHNLFGGQRWVDQYGDMIVTWHGTDVACKLNFIKASSWSNSRHEVRGAVTGGGARLRLQGRWSEALHAGEPPAARCLWRPGAMPPDHDLYYGFTRFATELNELEPNMTLPHTDTRLRPDQRALEEGDVEAAEQLKLQLEQAQRERRRSAPDHTPVWFRKSTEDGGEEEWVFTGEYWRARERGFPDLRAPRLW